jgi:hypothetical protein
LHIIRRGEQRGRAGEQEYVIGENMGKLCAGAFMKRQNELKEKLVSLDSKEEIFWKLLFQITVPQSSIC